MPELRKDPVVGRWVIISTERGRKPSDFTDRVAPKQATICPFCPGNEGLTPPEVLAYRPPGGTSNGPGWTLRVVPNKFPALQVEGSLQKRGEGLYDRMNGVGAHEVIIEGADHQVDFADMTEEQIASVLWSYRERMRDLKNDRRLRYSLVFKNHGEAAGASLEHTHTQLIATPILPKAVQEEIDGARAYYALKERCVFCDIVDQELAEGNGKRVVLTTERFVTIVPFAARFPFECWILPREHQPVFEAGTPEEYRELAGMLRESLQRLNLALDVPPYNLVIHTAPYRDSDHDYYHWHIEIMPKLTKIAGFEWGSGFYINPTPPEDSAAYLRDVRSAPSSNGSPAPTAGVRVAGSVTS
jgi:UDPglucose--hexose-1-phosphate uridylyltransferase